MYVTRSQHVAKTPCTPFKLLRSDHLITHLEFPVTESAFAQVFTRVLRRHRDFVFDPRDGRFTLDAPGRADLMSGVLRRGGAGESCWCSKAGLPDDSLSQYLWNLYDVLGCSGYRFYCALGRSSAAVAGRLESRSECVDVPPRESLGGEPPAPRQVSASRRTSVGGVSSKYFLSPLS